MFIKDAHNVCSTVSLLTSTSQPTTKRVPLSVVSAAILSTSVMLSLSMIAMPAQAAGLGELFGNNGAAQSKFLPVEQAFQVTSSSKATSAGTRFSINFAITPGHYVYKNQLSLNFPKGVRATPFTFSQSPVFINDPTFGKVPVFTQKNMVATTTLTSTTGKPIKNAAVIIGWQGCAKAGLCYPPEKIKTTVNVAASRK